MNGEQGGTTVWTGNGFTCTSREISFFFTVTMDLQMVHTENVVIYRERV